jgi:5'-phosphate synthase pdxT subunit
MSGCPDPAHKIGSMTTIGVLALQGDVREHLRALERCGVRSLPVRRVEELEACDGLVIPGGESTTMAKLARTFELLEPLRLRIKAGLPCLGTCAGMILLAERILNGIAGQETFGGLDVTVRRNAFGRQVDSFEGDLHLSGLDAPVHAVFIRAPWVEEAGAAVDVLARVEEGPAAGRIVAVRQGPLMATSFHPEVGGDSRVHRMFVDLVRGRDEPDHRD